MLKNSTLVLLVLFSFLCHGNIDSSAQKNEEIKKIIIDNPNLIDGVDTLLISSIFLDPQEDIFTPSFFSVGSGLYKFPILLNSEDNGWMSQNVMLIYNTIEFKTDTTPYTFAKYDNTYSSANWFTAGFDRMIGKSKISAKLNRNFQNSAFPNSKAKRFNFSVGTELPFNEKYEITLCYFRNLAIIEENGGFKNSDSISFIDKLDETTLVSNLSSASNAIFLQKASINQMLKINSKIRLNILTEYEENKYSFSMLQEDFKSDFFSNSFLDTTETFDSIGFRKINIQPMLRLGGMHENKSSTSFDIGIHEEMNNKSVLNNSYGMGRLNFHVNDNPISIISKYYYQNVWKGNYDFNGKVNWQFKKEIGDTIKYLSNLFVNVSFRNQLPSYLFLNYFGNHFRWENNFNPTQTLKINALLNLNKLNSLVACEVQNISNYIYLNEKSLPQQNEKNIRLSKISLKKQWGTKFIKVFSGLGFQYSSSSLIRIPSFYTRTSFVYDFKLRKVPFNLGSTFNFFSKYTGLNYNPAIRHYHLGNQTVGGTPIVDFFLSSRLGPADVYIKYDNTFYNLNRDLFIGENYPITFSFLHLGLKWNLTN